MSELTVSADGGAVMVTAVGSNLVQPNASVTTTLKIPAGRLFGSSMVDTCWLLKSRHEKVKGDWHPETVICAAPLASPRHFTLQDELNPTPSRLAASITFSGCETMVKPLLSV